MERRHSEDLVEQSADRITDLILRSTHYEMLHNDRDALYNVIQELGSEPGIQRIRIFNKEGRITLSTDAARGRHAWWTRAPRPATAATRNRRRSPSSTGRTARASSPTSRASACWR